MRPLALIGAALALLGLGGCKGEEGPDVKSLPPDQQAKAIENDPMIPPGAKQEALGRVNQDK